MKNSFLTDIRYFDNKHYPRGFSRYGCFTIKEAKLLENCGHAYYALNNGKRDPINDEENKFIKVCRGKLKASSKHEKVWLKYLTYINRPKCFHTLSGGKPQIDINEDIPENEI